jgi:transcriptional regulator with XRE-family HTH domain
MATRRVEIGPAGEVVRAQVAALRKDHLGLTLRDLSERMTAVGWPMAHNTISEIERGARRVDVDDLCALAGALGVSPGYLLGADMPPHSEAIDLIMKRLNDTMAELPRRLEEATRREGDRISAARKENDHGDD